MSVKGHPVLLDILFLDRGETKEAITNKLGSERDSTGNLAQPHPDSVKSHAILMYRRTELINTWLYGSFLSCVEATGSFVICSR